MMTTPISSQSAENKLTDALNQLRSQPKETTSEVEIIPEKRVDVEVHIDEPPKEPRRAEWVQTDDPKVIERINDLYGQVKKSDARNQELAAREQMIIEHNRLMEQKLSEYADKLDKFEQNTKRTASNQVETELKTRLRQAREEHDLDTIEQIEDKLFNLRLEQRISDNTPKETPKPQFTPNPQADKELLKNAAYVEIISQEKDSNGQLVRDYLFDGHPDNWKAVQMFESLPKEFAAAGKQPDIRVIMDTIHERIKGRKTQASVLSGDNDDAPARRTVKLTQEQANVAKRMGITPEAYARQLQLINS